MIGGLKRAYDRFRGFGDFALSVPSLDGAFRPNSDIEDADIVVQLDRPDNLAVSGKEVFVSSGSKLLRLDGNVATLVEDGNAPITALAAGPSGQLAIARSGGPITLRAPDGSTRTLPALIGKGDVTALCLHRDNRLAVAIGAEGKPVSQWRHDLLDRGRTGAIWSLDQTNQATRLASRLAYPYGVVEAPDGNLILALAWSSSLARLDTGGQITAVLENLPGYPARLMHAQGGGYWLALFAPRNQLLEFVLREATYRKRMMSEIDPDYWVCPKLEQRHGPLDVMQDGAQKVGGEMKPWAPTFSAGLIVRLDNALLPAHSHQSRADGIRHGITSLVEHDGRLLANSWGGNVVVSLPTTEVPA